MAAWLTAPHRHPRDSDATAGGWPDRSRRRGIGRDWEEISVDFEYAGSRQSSSRVGCRHASLGTSESAPGIGDVSVLFELAYSQ
jgi:hypothetical protein